MDTINAYPSGEDSSQESSPLPFYLRELPESFLAELDKTNLGRTLEE